MEAWIYIAISLGVVMIIGLICVILWRVGVFGKPTDVGVPAGEAVSLYNPCARLTGIAQDGPEEKLSTSDRSSSVCGRSLNALVLIHNPDGQAASSVICQYAEGVLTKVPINGAGLIVHTKSVAVLRAFVAAYIVTVSASGTLNQYTGSTNGSEFSDFSTYVVVDYFDPGQPRQTFNIISTQSDETPQCVCTIDGQLYVAWFNTSTMDSIIRSYTFDLTGKPSTDTKEAFIVKSQRSMLWSANGHTIAICTPSSVLVYRLISDVWTVVQTITYAAAYVQVCNNETCLALHDGRETVTLYTKSDLTADFALLTEARDANLGSSMAYLSSGSAMLIAYKAGIPRMLPFATDSKLVPWNGSTVCNPADFVGGDTFHATANITYDSLFILSDGILRHFVKCA